MEEILASIRRIIEDNDSGRKPGADEPAVIPPPANQDREEPAFRAELRGGFNAGLPQTISLENSNEIKAVDASSYEAGRFETRVHEVVAPEIAGEAVVEAHSKQFEAANPVAGFATAPAEVATSFVSHEADVGTETPEAVDFQIAEQSVTASIKEEAAEINETNATTGTAPDAESVASQGIRPAILSDFAGHQVAAAFGELSEMVAARPRRSVDDIAQEMLRPMLQEWLDNKLPPLVEKLVREEIERVVRGG
ncbi:PopZ family protein [Corticibacterium sp. UT-5YL-CI-8]|nr:PopZ family protein [Tianweitania sp. UT-5YL-CI-8]